ncbi:MAG: single-stranded DNA-binding protein [Faecalibacterium prausnitzii]
MIPSCAPPQRHQCCCSFRIACDRNFAMSWASSVRPDFIDIVAWRQQAEFVCKYFQKGSLIAMDGSLQTRQYQDKNGNNRTAVEVVAQQHQLCWLQRAAMQVTETAIRMPLRPTRTQRLPVRLLWRQLPATLPAMPTTSPSSTTAMTCRSDTKRSIR